MLIVCPGCGKKQEIEHVERGRRAECLCGTVFTLDDATVLRDYTELDSPPPEKIGPYPIERFIGRGGMGRVYKGFHPGLQMPVAVKTLLKEYANNEPFKDRFIKSARICAKLSHPNVVRVYDFGVTADGTLYLVLEYIGGGTLFDLLSRSGPLTPKRTAEAGLAMCGALEAAEKAGIVHRDIKPDNIMIDSEGVYKLSDLGLAKIEAKNPPPKVNLSETVSFTGLGTPEYMAPEQALDAKHADLRADIYSLGVTLYQLVTGRLPFDAHDPLELRRKHFEELPKVPGEYRDDIPFALDFIIMKCMQKDKSERYQTPEELRADLEAFLAGRELPSENTLEPSEKAEPPAAPPAPASARRLILLLALLLAMTFLMFAVRSWRRMAEKVETLPPLRATHLVAPVPADVTPDKNVYQPVAVSKFDKELARLLQLPGLPPSPSGIIALPFFAALDEIGFARFEDDLARLRKKFPPSPENKLYYDQLNRAADAVRTRLQARSTEGTVRP